MRILVLGDVHLPFTNWDCVKAASEFAKAYKPNLIVQIGDLVDSYNWSLFKKSTDAPSPHEEMELAIDSFYKLMYSFPKKLGWQILEGNHCLSSDTEIYCNGGWKKFDQINKGDICYGLDLEGKLVEQKIEDIIIKNYHGEMIKYQYQLTDPEHRMLYKEQNKKILLYDEVKNIKGRRIQIPISAYSYNLIDDTKYSDDEIAITAWLLTDSSIRNDYVYFHQGDKYKIITDILNNLHVKYSIYTRSRNITHICGKKLKNKPKPSNDIHLNREGSNKLLNLIDNKDKNRIPKWVYNLSKRQFDIFLKHLMIADGTMGTTFYCSRKQFGEQFELLCFKNGYSVKFSNYKTHNGIYQRYYICEKSWGNGFDGKFENGISKIDYNDIIWCVSVANSNFLVRREGRSFITGNCRRKMLRAMDVNLPKQLIKPLGELFVDSRCQWHLEIDPLILDNTAFIHGDEMAGNAWQKAQKLGMNLIQGHDHQGYLQFINTFKKRIFGMSVGCMIDGASIAARYAAKNPMKCFLGWATLTDGVPHLYPF